MMNKLGIILLGLCLTALPVRGATISAASPSLADVTIAVTLASSGDTVTIPPGTASWSGSVTVSKDITIQGAGATSTVLNNSSTVTGGGTPALIYLADGGNNSNARRVTGIGFKGALINSQFNKAGTGVNATGWLSRKRIDHCQFDDLYCAVWAQSSTGLTDHNTIRNVAVPFRHSGVGNQQQYAWDNFRPLAFDSLNYMFHENETIEMSGDSGICDEVEACSWVIRFCTITCRSANGPYTAAQNYPLADCHGDNPNTYQYSALSTLFYENTITVQSGAGMYPMLQIRGGRGEVFNNTVTSTGGSGTAQVTIWDENYYYESPTCQSGGSCAWYHWGQQPTPVGGSQYLDRTIDVYVWNNKYNGTVQGPGTGNGGANVIFASTPVLSPDPTKSYCWTSAPTTVVTPPYPHPLVTPGSGGGRPGAPSSLRIVNPGP